MTFFLSSILDNLTSTIVMVSLLRKLVPQSEYRKYEQLFSLCSSLVKLFTVGERISSVYIDLLRF